MEVDQPTQDVTPDVLPLQNSPKRPVNMWLITSIVLAIILVGLSAYVIRKNISPKAPTIQPNITQFVTQTASSPTAMQVSVTKTLTGSVSSAPSGKQISAGMKTQFFSPYTLTVPNGWTDSHTASTASDTLTLTQGQYVLTILQTSAGAGGCSYQGETPAPMSQVFSSFVGITGIFSQMRRGTSDGVTYTVCEQKDSGFSFPTSVGYITYKTPSQPIQGMLTQMDSMVASVSK